VCSVVVSAVSDFAAVHDEPPFQDSSAARLLVVSVLSSHHSSEG
jgi:hypothetical protein